MADQIRARHPERIHQREHVVGHVVDADLRGQRAVAPAGAAMIVEDDAVIARRAPRGSAPNSAEPPSPGDRIRGGAVRRARAIS
jgi:hypothetical protein